MRTVRIKAAAWRRSYCSSSSEAGNIKTTFMPNTLPPPPTVGSEPIPAFAHGSNQLLHPSSPVAFAPDRHMPWVYTLFFFSGFPALIYQIVWQRSLFVIYGINIESVTIVVSAFMLGLGLGSL